MRFDSGKAFPYPVLRPGSSDYPDAEFQAELQLQRREQTTSVRLTAEFHLSEPGLLDLIERGLAHYVLILSCSTTHIRTAYSTTDGELQRDIRPGTLSGLTELSPYVVATSDLHEFHLNGWHDDYGDLTPFDVQAGCVLATDTPKSYFVDNAEETPIGSIFETTSSPGATSGCWDCNLEGERIEIILFPSDHTLLSKARQELAGKADAAYLMNSLYLPALHHVLVLADSSVADYEDRRWFRALNARLADAECQPLGSTGSNRLKDAQRLLEYPFCSMPCLQERHGE